PSFCFQRSPDPRALHSFPTRRSSDLARTGEPRQLHAAVRQPAQRLQLVLRERLGRVEIERARLRELEQLLQDRQVVAEGLAAGGDRKSTRLNSSHDQISYAVFCLKKK